LNDFDFEFPKKKNKIK